jgi:hypothetical protein
MARSPIASGRKMRASISFGVPLTMGANSICARMSRSMSIPGATSVSTSPLSLSSNTQRSVTYSTGWPRSVAMLPEKVRCSTCCTNFFMPPSWWIASLPPATSSRIVPAGEGADEHDLLRVLRDVDEAARAGQLGPELRHVEVAFAVGLGEAENARSSPPPS